MNRSKVNDPRFWALWERSGAIGRVIAVTIEVVTRIDYSKVAVTTDYKCKKCGATGCKLWREYQTFSPQLLCCDCAAKDQKKNISNMGADGRYSNPDDELFRDQKTDQIGWYVPAVPDEEGVGYWGYTSVPEPGCQWWRRLPVRPNAPTAIAV